MKKRLTLAVCSVVTILFISSGIIYAQEVKSIKLLAAQMEGGKSLMQALKERKSLREFSSKELSWQVISELLWAANGIVLLDSIRYL